MAIDFNGARQKVNDLNRSAIRIVDMMASLESGALFGMALTQTQITTLNNQLKSEADNLKTIAGEIKNMVSS